VRTEAADRIREQFPALSGEAESALRWTSKSEANILVATQPLSYLRYAVAVCGWGLLVPPEDRFLGRVAAATRNPIAMRRQARLAPPGRQPGGDTDAHLQPLVRVE